MQSVLFLLHCELDRWFDPVKVAREFCKITKVKSIIYVSAPQLGLEAAFNLFRVAVLVPEIHYLQADLSQYMDVFR